MKIFIKLFLLWALAFNTSAQIPEDQAIIKSINDKYFSNSMTFDLDMNLYLNAKLIRSYKMEVVKNQSKLWMAFSAPAIEKGRRMLNDGDNLWMYLPRSKKLIRLPYKQSFMGSDASNRDILRISLVDDYILEQKEESESNLIFSFKAKDLSVSYNQMKLYVTKEHVLLKQELFALSGKKLKTIQYSNIQNINGLYFPMKAEIVDELKGKSRTELVYSNISFVVDKPDSFFTTAALQK